MQYQLKENIVSMVKEKGLSIRRLERDAGLHKNFISNFLYDKSKNPGIESIIKIAEVLDVSIDELIGKEAEHKIHDLDITKKDIFSDVLTYLLKSMQDNKIDTINTGQFFDAAYEIYVFSLKKDIFDKEFADWYITSQI